jgi:hypothetical protein
MIGNRGIDQDVQNKVDAYRGNPNALAQKYQQNQQLIDLLALQKLKSEKESAAREMQLKMGGQQMPTIAESRENEVLDLTKQELAQNTTGAMQQQQAQKQQAAKDLVERTAQMPMQSQSPMMQGVAGLPANNMSPQAMAGGGIVAFDQGGSTDPLAGVSGVGPEAMARDRERLERARQEEEERRAQRRAYDIQSGLITTAPPVSTEQAQAQDIESGQGARAPAAPAAPAPQQRQAAPQGQPGIAGIDPRAIAMRNEIAKYIGFSPEERARREKGMAELAALDAKRFDPDRRRSQGLTRWLLGGAGRTGIGSVLGGAGAASENYKEGMDAQERQSLLGRQKQVDELIAADVGVRKDATTLGFKTATDYAEIAARQAATALSRESMNQDKALKELQLLEGRFNESVRIADTNYNNTIKQLSILPPAEQQRLSEAARLERQKDILDARQRLTPIIQEASRRAGISGAGAGGNFRIQSITPGPNP